MTPPLAYLGWMTEPLTRLLTAIHTVLPGHSWAWSIVVLTCIVRLAILPIGIKQTTSMLRMQHLQPHIKKLQERYKDDKQEQQAKLMEFYRDNKVNPFASCLPLLIQIPIFLALFSTLNHYKFPANANLSFLGGFVPNITTDINQAGAAGWVLVVVYVASQMWSSWVMSANTPNQQQRKLFLIMPVLFVPFILSFPIGVMIYWITTNFWTLGQYKIIMALADTNPPEVVLPEDSKGVKRVVQKTGKEKSASASKTKGASSGSADGDTEIEGRAPRPNKRRR